MSKGDLIEMDGEITEALGGGKYSVQTRDSRIIAQLAGKLRRNHIRVLPGDKVRVSVSPYDLTNGLITYRGR